MAYTKTIWENLPSTNTPINETNLNKIENELGRLNEVILYQNETGEASDITLSDTVANYTSLEIFYRANDGTTAQGYTKVDNPNGQYALLQRPTINGTGTGFFIKAKEVYINENQISNNGRRYIQVSLTTSVSVTNENDIYIQKVIGYK